MATEPSYTALYVYLDPYGDKRYLAVKNQVDKQGRYTFREPEPIGGDYGSSRREPFYCTKSGKKKWYLEGFDFRKEKDTLSELCEVEFSTRKPYYIHSQVLYPKSYAASDELYATKVLEGEVYLPRLMKEVYAVGELLHRGIILDKNEAIERIKALENEELNRHNKVGRRAEAVRELEKLQEEFADIDLAKESLSFFETEYVGVGEAADFIERDPSLVRKFAREGRLGVLVDGRYLFTRRELAEYMEKERPSGIHRE